MELTTKNVTFFLKDYSKVKDLMKTSFPRDEQYPILLLQLVALKSNVDFLAYYDEDTFCGFSYTIQTNQMTFVLYLAVNSAIRSKGYGGRIIEQIKRKAENRVIALNIEMIDKNAENYLQRLKRYNFYEKNGFNKTNYYVEDKSGSYDILTANGSFIVTEYKRILKNFTFGLLVPKVKKESIL